MNRREFLRMRSGEHGPVAELSCARVFVHFQDLCSGFQQGTAEAGRPNDADWWEGEPAITITRSNPDVFFHSLLEAISQSEKLLVKETEWLSDEDFRMHMDTLFAAFRARGGAIEFAYDSRINHET